MKLADLIETVINTVQDPSVTPQQVKSKINAGIYDAAGTISVPLPDLEITTTVTTVANQAWVSMPSTFHRDLDFCYSATQNERITILHSLQELRAKYPDMTQSGSIWYVARSAGRLYYQGIPATEDTLTLQFYQYPTLLSKDSDEPDVFPKHLHERLFVNYACREFFKVIEDGIEGPKINTQYHHGEYQSAIADLETWIGPKYDEPVLVNDLISDLMQ